VNVAWRPAFVDAVELTDPGRPRDRPTPGWGMLRCVRTLRLRSPDDGELVHFVAGTTRISRDHWAARARPEAFAPACRDDRATAKAHMRNLEHVRQQLERGRPAARRRTTGGVLPSRRAPGGLRLPTGPSYRPLRLP
jgi:hypothetical protein